MTMIIDMDSEDYKQFKAKHEQKLAEFREIIVRAIAKHSAAMTFRQIVAAISGADAPEIAKDLMGGFAHGDAVVHLSLAQLIDAGRVVTVIETGADVYYDVGVLDHLAAQV
jgi:hypothetical protein